MEPTNTTIKFSTTVDDVYELSRREWVCGYGHAAKFNIMDRGWFIKLSNSYEAIGVGFEKPNVTPGDIATVRITFHADPSKPLK